MKDLHTTPNDHLEARITAWILGEASPFEAAELEALCAADPELQIFANRIKALHSLLIDSQNQSSDPFWKLSPEKREKLDPIIGPNNSSQPGKDSSIRRAAYRTAFGIAAVLTVTVFIKRFIFVSPSMDKESVTIVSYESSYKSLPEPRGMIVDAEADSLPPMRKEIASGEKKSKNIATSALKKPSAPSASLPTTRQIDNTLADADVESGKLRERLQSLELAIPSELPAGMAAAKSESSQSNSPQSAMLQALAAAETSDSNTIIPVPEIALNTPSPNFGDGKDFGGGWGGGQNKVADSKNDGGIGYAQFEGSGGGGGNRDFSNIAIAGEVFAAKDDAFASNEPQNKGGFKYEPNKGNEESLRSYGSLSYEGKLAEVEKRMNADSSITPEDSISLTGLFDSYKTQNTEDLRRGEHAKERNSIDGILSNPDRSIATEQGGGRGPTVETLKNDLAFTDTDSSHNNPTARREFEKRVDTHSDSFRPDKEQTATESLIETDKGLDFALRAGTERNEDPLSNNAKIGYLSYSRDLSASDLNSLQKQSDPFAAKPTDIEGFINYGSPILSEPKQIDITTKFVEGVQENTKATGFGGITHPSANDELDLFGPVDPAKPIEFESLATGYTGEVPLLGDIPVNGKLFQEGKLGNIEHEISVGYKSEYLFRGLKFEEQKKPSLTDLSEEISTSEEPFSTFSLNISDASFQLAIAAIEKGERPDPASIKPEQFYNAVDYGDPAPSASEPVAAAIDQTAHPVIPGRNLVRVAVRTASSGRSAAQPLRLTLLVDQSGSMVRADRRAAMDIALAQLATLLTENDRITVIGFSRTPHLLADSLPGNEAAKLPALINQTANESGTNLEQAINLASELALRHRLDGAQNRIVLFTDGAANLGDADPDRLSEKIKTLRQQNLAFDIAGIGTNDLNDRLLSDLARHGNGRYYLVGEKTANTLADQLAGAFRPAAENVKIQVKLNPQRVGQYKLIGFEKDRLKTEDFRNDAVDAAELAADEAGVALYQVETLPQGSGEIGEVSIRFRDTATDEMVERTYTIPYDSNSPSFDKANPKTQLATLALLAAQKLQPGPMADAIDFSNYSETIAKLKQANAKSAKNQQMLNLINQLK